MTTAPKEFASEIFASPIMVVDDTELNRIFLDKMLRARGFTNILPVASAEEVLEKISTFQPEILLLDILMPDGMDGFECCETLRKQERYRDLPILIQTSITEPQLRVKAFQKGATDFVSKPINADELCARVMVHLENRLSLRSLQIYKKRIAAELESARQLQLGILPEETVINECADHCGLTIRSYFEPSSEIGGDFWGLSEVFPHQTAVWLTDFSGHGMAAAINAFRLDAYMREYTSLAARPGEYLALLNDKLLHLLQRGQFATMFYGIVDTQSNQLFYACACMPHPIILRQSTGKAEMIDGTGTPLGVGMHLYSTKNVPFSSGDLLLLYSDALIETPNAAGDFITEEMIMNLLEKNSDASADVLLEVLLGYFKQHSGGELRDDLTVVICARSNL